MGIYIKEMDMPKSCIECLLHGESACKAFTTIEPWTFKDDERAAFCPLTEVPGPKWNPCSERLPEQSDDYICTIPLDEKETFAKVLTFHKGRFYEDDDEWGNTFYDDVIAWMPLPTPYKGGDTE